MNALIWIFLYAFWAGAAVFIMVSTVAYIQNRIAYKKYMIARDKDLIWESEQEAFHERMLAIRQEILDQEARQAAAEATHAEYEETMLAIEIMAELEGLEGKEKINDLR